LLPRNVGIVFRAGLVVVALTQQPVVALFSWPLRHPYEMPPAGQLLALEREFEMALPEPLPRVSFRHPRPAIPDNDRAATIFAFRDRSLEVAIVERMVLDMDGQPLFRRHKARAASDRPALEHAVHLQPEIIVQ